MWNLFTALIMILVLLVLFPSGLVEAFSSGEDSLGRAEQLVGDLALSRERQRTTSSYLCIAGGTLLLGAAVFDDSEGQDAAVFQMGMGVLGTLAIIGGSFLLSRRLQAEKAYETVRDVEEFVEREEAAALFLERLAVRGRQRRFVTGALLSLLATGPVIQLFGGAGGMDDTVLLFRASVSLGLAAYSFLVPSRAEKNHQLLTLSER